MNRHYFSVSRWVSGFTLAAAAAGLHAQDNPFSSRDMERIDVPGNKCTGFYNTPAWKCEPITIPVYLRRAANPKALVAITHGSQGLDIRHANYAKQLTDNGINAVVIGHWEARGLGKIQDDYDKARRQGGDSPNMVLDVLAVLAHFKNASEFKDAKVGHIGESIGGVTAMNLTRPYLRRAFADSYGKQPPQLSAIAAL
jgi:hypothetical protein